MTSFKSMIIAELLGAGAAASGRRHRQTVQDSGAAERPKRRHHDRENGSYNYVCGLHPSMTGKIEVK
jgi:plastocyanin